MAESNVMTRRDMDDEQSDVMQLVGFKLGSELFGVDILMVQEIIRSAPITPVPNSPDFVDGVINLRGGIIPVVDLRRRLNVATEDAAINKDWVVILEIEGRVTGFIVDRVTEVLKISENSIEAAPEIISAGLESQYVRGVCEIGDKLLVLLDFQRILLVEEVKHLQALEVEPVEEALAT